MGIDIKIFVEYDDSDAPPFCDSQNIKAFVAEPVDTGRDPALFAALGFPLYRGFSAAEFSKNSPRGIPKIVSQSFDARVGKRAVQAWALQNSKQQSWLYFDELIEVLKYAKLDLQDRTEGFRRFYDMLKVLEKAVGKNRARMLYWFHS